MFWKLMILAALVWAVAMYFSFTLGGLIHLLPVVVVVFSIVRRMARNPNTEFGKWRARPGRSQ
jgi:F0F1-type ATP synthase assembly protein I